MAIKNQQITITYNAWSADTGLAITGDVANHTCRLSQDGGAFATATNSPAELGYGVYKLTLTAAETNCNALTLQVSSSTSGVVCPPVQITFDAAISAPTASAIADAVWMYNPSDADYAGTSSLAWHLDVIRQRMIELPIASEIGTAVWNTNLGPYPSSGTFAGTALNVARSAASSAAGRTYPTLAQITAGVWNSIIMVDGTTTASAKEQVNTICSAVNAIRYADIANAVWSATTRTITGGMLTTEPPTVAQIQSGLATSAEISALSIPTASAIADAVCDEALSGHTTAGTLGKVISDTATATTATAISTAVGEIDTAVDTINTTVDAMQQTVLTINSNVQAISGYTDELEDMVQDLPTSSAIADTVWGRSAGSSAREITNIPTDYSKLTASDIPTPPSVAEIQSGLATSTAVSDVKTVVDGIATSALTSADIPTPPTAAAVATEVWGAEVRTLTSQGAGGTTAQEVWEYAARTLTASPTDITALATQAGLTALQSHGDDHWGATVDGDVTVNIDNAAIANAVWSHQPRTLSGAGVGNDDNPALSSDTIISVSTGSTGPNNIRARLKRSIPHNGTLSIYLKIKDGSTLLTAADLATITYTIQKGDSITANVFSYMQANGSIINKDVEIPLTALLDTPVTCVDDDGNADTYNLRYTFGEASLLFTDSPCNYLMTFAATKTDGSIINPDEILFEVA